MDKDTFLTLALIERSEDTRLWANQCKVEAHCCDEETNTTMDDTFELYDLRVDVVCPPGEKIYCGAKEGDHFILQGEMLHLPNDQGFSIYSLGGWLDQICRPQQLC